MYRHDLRTVHTPLCHSDAGGGKLLEKIGDILKPCGKLHQLQNVAVCLEIVKGLYQPVYHLQRFHKGREPRQIDLFEPFACIFKHRLCIDLLSVEKIGEHRSQSSDLGKKFE